MTKLAVDRRSGWLAVPLILLAGCGQPAPVAKDKPSADQIESKARENRIPPVGRIK